MQKICPKCPLPIPKALTEFHRSSRNPDGYQLWCKACKNAALQDARRRNPTKTKRQRRESYLRNQATMCARRRRNHAINSLDPAYRQAEVRRVAAWRKNNPQKKKLADMRRDARKAGLPDTMTPEDVAFLYQYWHFACAICGTEEGLFGVTLVLDHWIALADEHCPGTVPTNMVLLCNGPGSCNTSKLHTPVLDWLTRRYGARKSRQVIHKVQAYFAVVRKRAEQEEASCS